ncbi:MAG TPA: arginine--tRNA ligase [Candidatus Nitrosopelagicus sp.]|jgi:arginyl-tRNA synthetase|nr:arginine--tRNA ligase [Candidatus Nitrosopelagicus sp.]
MALLKILKSIRELINSYLSENNISSVNFTVELSKPGFGDITCNVAFLLSKKLHSSPQDISQKIVDFCSKKIDSEISKVMSHPAGHINFEINFKNYSKSIILESIVEQYGDIDIGHNEKLIIEHTSVNPNKALHIGHIRNVVLGDIISRILKKANFDIRVLNYIDDSGLQVADIIVGFRYCGFSETPPNNEKFDHYCGDSVYVGTTEKYSKDKELELKRHSVLKEIEDINSETSKFAQNITRKVLSAQLETIWQLGVTYDCLNFESQIIHSKLWEKIFEKLKSKNLVRLESGGKNDGCWVISAKDEEDKILVRSNGVATYIAKDIPYAAWKLGIIDDPFNYKVYSKQGNDQILYETTLEKNSEPKQNFSGEKVITVIDNRQIRLQKIVTDLMRLFSGTDSYIHLGYESVTLSANTASKLGLETNEKSVQMSGRKGLYVDADLILSKLKNKIFEESKKRNANLDTTELNEIAKSVSVGTIRYEMIKPDLDKIISFDLDTSLKIEGDTCSYIQYSYARASRILEKSDIKPNFDNDLSNFTDQYEINLIKKIATYDLQVNDAANNLSPKVISRYCYELSVTFSSFYEHVMVLNAETDELKNSRLCLVSSFQSTLANALSLLGIDAPVRM